MKFATKEILEKIDEYISTHREEILSDLISLVRIPSVRSRAEDGAPYGKECRRALEAVVELYKKNGIDARIDPEGNYAISSFGKGEKTVGIFAHADVVPADGEWLMTDPFEPIIKDGYIFGRGTEDDKSGIVEALYATKIIRELGIGFNSNLTIFTGANEESGMGDIAAFIRNEKMPDASVIPDGDYPCYTGECSLFRFKLTSKHSLASISGAHGGEATNIILGAISAEVSDAALLAELAEAAKTNERISIDGSKITAKGLSTHVMHADQSLNAAKVLAEALLGCPSLPECDRATLDSIVTLLSSPFGHGLGIDHDDENFGKLVCGTGVVRMTDDARIMLTFDVRVGLSYPLDELRADAIKASEALWSFEETNSSEGYYIPEGSMIRTVLENTYGELAGLPEVKGSNTAGGTHARKMKNAMPIGTVADYKKKPITLPEGHGGVHQPDECMSVEGFLEGIKILTAMVLELDGALRG